MFARDPYWVACELIDARFREDNTWPRVEAINRMQIFISDHCRSGFDDPVVLAHAALMRSGFYAQAEAFAEQHRVT